jgi:hypothetical protein
MLTACIANDVILFVIQNVTKLDHEIGSEYNGLRSTQPIIEISTSNLPRSTGRPKCKADKFTAIYEPTVQKRRKARRFTTLWTSTDSYRDSFTFYHVNHPNLVTCWVGLNGTITAPSVAHNRCLVLPKYQSNFPAI